MPPDPRRLGPVEKDPRAAASLVVRSRRRRRQSVRRRSVKPTSDGATPSFHDICSTLDPGRGEDVPWLNFPASITRNLRVPTIKRPGTASRRSQFVRRRTVPKSLHGVSGDGSRSAACTRSRPGESGLGAELFTVTVMPSTEG